MTPGCNRDPTLLAHARRHGVKAVCAVAESLPFHDGVFDHALIVTTICFVDDARAMLLEAYRVLKPTGALHRSDQPPGPALRNLSARERVLPRCGVLLRGRVDRLLSETGFGERAWRQTLTKPLSETVEVEPSRPGFGDAAFVAVRALKDSDRRS